MSDTIVRRAFDAILDDVTKWQRSIRGAPSQAELSGVLALEEFLAVTRALDDENRVRALMALRTGELCLCQIIDLLGLAPSTVSKHMSLLLAAGLVERRKRGRWHFFRLVGEAAPPALREILGWVIHTLAEDATVAADARRLPEIFTRDLEDLAACYRS